VFVPLGVIVGGEVGGLLVGSMGSSMPGAGRLNPLEE